MKLRILPVALSLLALSFVLPAANAATCVGSDGPAVCVHTKDCQAVTATTGATDFYPGAGACRVPPSGGALLCERVFAGFASLGGFYGANARLCVGGEGVFVGCATVHDPDVLTPICL